MSIHHQRRLWNVVWVLALLVAAAWCQPPWPSGPLPLTTAPELTLGGQGLLLTMAQSSEGYDIRRLVNAATYDVDFEEGPLWTLATVLPGTTGASQVLTPGDFGTVGALVLPDALFIAWSDPLSLSEPLVVTARIWFVDSTYHFDIEVRNENDDLVLESVTYPIFRAKPLRKAPYREYLVLPVLGGTVQLEPWSMSPTEYHNPGTALQLFSLFDRVDHRLLTWHTRDGEGYRKEFVCAGQGTSLLFGVIQFPPDNHISADTYVSPYPLTLTSMSGTWYDAAVHYRQWALTQAWASRGPIEASPAFSKKMLGLKLHGLQYPDHALPFDDFPALVADALRVSSHLGLRRREMMLMWSDWHAQAFNVAMPDFAPARSSVSSALTHAHAAGLLVIPYTCINYWSPDSSSYAAYGVEDYMWTLADGTTPVIHFGPQQSSSPHLRINPAHEGARTASLGVIADVLDSVTPAGWDGVYLDTWSHGYPELDYNPLLPVKGGTSAWKQGQRVLGSAVQEFVKDVVPYGVVTSEFIQETVIDSVELFHYHPYMLGLHNYVQLPVWETVYHRYVMTSNIFGTVPQPNAEQVARILTVLSYDYHLGKVLGISNFFATNQPWIHPDPGVNQGIVVFDYLRALLAIEDHARNYRMFGEPLRPIEASIAHSIETLDYFLSGCPPASTSLWRAKDGEIGILITNHASSPVAIDIEIDFQTYGLSGTRRLFLNDLGNRILIGTYAGSILLPAVSVPPLSAHLLELVED